MLSKPFSLRAAQITASIDARYGEARFQLTNVKSEPLAGLTFEDCEPIRGVDDTERPIRWKNAQLDSRLGQPLRLEMKFTGANVYGLRRIGSGSTRRACTCWKTASRSTTCSNCDSRGAHHPCVAGNGRRA